MIFSILLGIMLVHFIYLAFHFKNNLKGFLPVQPKETHPSHPAGVSIIIPARNECRGIQKTLESLSRQTTENLEILVVDDHSSDDTPLIVKAFSKKDKRVFLHHAPPLPPGWLGKTHAMAYGASLIRFNRLLFADADVEFSKHAITTALYEMDSKNLELLTLIPQMVLGSIWEKAIQPIMLSIILFGMNIKRVNDPSDPQAVGVGAFLFIRREAYERIGGHQAIRDQMIDDYALALQVKKSGGAICVADGRHLIKLRMYHSLKEIWQGWGKNFFDGLKLPFRMEIGTRQMVLWQNKPLITFIFVSFYLVFTFILPPIAFIWTVYSTPDLVYSLLSFPVFMSALVFSFSLFHRLGYSGGWSLFLPMGAVIIFAIAIASALQSLVRGGPVWRNRRYPFAG